MDAAELNRRLNRAARLVNLAAVTVADGGGSPSKSLTEKLVGVLAEIADAQHSLFRTHPELEYHFDPDRAPTAFMRTVQRLERESEEALAAGNRALAAQKINEALGLEPPPLAYEVLERRRNEMSCSA
jgi:hypothetical protein